MLTSVDHKLYDLLTTSLKPVHALVSIAAFVVCVLVGIELTLSEPNVHASDLALLASFTNGWIVLGCFLIYSVGSAYSCLSSARTTFSKRTRYAVSMLGICLWSADMAAVLVHSTAGTSVLHVMPIIAEMWVLVQLSSNIRDQDRRKL